MGVDYTYVLLYCLTPGLMWSAPVFFACQLHIRTHQYLMQTAFAALAAICQGDTCCNTARCMHLPEHRCCSSTRLLLSAQYKRAACKNVQTNAGNTSVKLRIVKVERAFVFWTLPRKAALCCLKALSTIECDTNELGAKILRFKHT